MSARSVGTSTQVQALGLKRNALRKKTRLAGVSSLVVTELVSSVVVMESVVTAARTVFAAGTSTTIALAARSRGGSALMVQAKPPTVIAPAHLIHVLANA